ncbi:DNA polymerase IV [Vibrio ishigakensis]|uniref:DNA-directed DNA polymerase n=1 Tax=Vibrio ishigakensis TaxID=1481914 RepID=A0A0B8PQW6_9VIBR|nr:DNA polymerase IV [Vibrio ishigakensis]
MRDFPQYRGRPLAVGGNEAQRGVLSTCNYEARKFGIRSAMPTAQAKKLCPQLLVVPGRMQVYKDVSAQIRAIFARYTKIIEPLSLDEAYLDVTECTQHKGSATLIAEAIRKDILDETGLTASAGVAPIKFLAKVASDLNKPMVNMSFRRARCSLLSMRCHCRRYQVLVRLRCKNSIAVACMWERMFVAATIESY